MPMAGIDLHQRKTAVDLSPVIGNVASLRNAAIRADAISKRIWVVAIVSFGDLVRHDALHHNALIIVPVSSSTALEASLSAAHGRRAARGRAPGAGARGPGGGGAV